MKKNWSCFDLHHSLYLGHDEMRTCCKRFYKNGHIQGDVVLFEISGDETSQDLIDKSLQAKINLHGDINANKDTLCDGCPYLEYKDWGDINEGLKLKALSFEYHSVCNLKCTYCSDTYYGGKQPKYDVLQFLKTLKKNHLLENCETYRWGGGEPTADKNFLSLLNTTLEEKCTDHRVFTNAVKFSGELSSLISNNKVRITTSVDAGTDETFLQVRGGSKLRVVLSNLKKYASVRPENVTIKYILTEDNIDIAEIESFVDLIKEYNLKYCHFQVSSNFKDDQVSREALIATIVLYGLLSNLNVNTVFVDDLLWGRIKQNYVNYSHLIKSKIDALGYSSFLADCGGMDSVIVWGAGKIAQDMISNSVFFKNIEVQYFVDSDLSKIGCDFMEKEVFHPKVLIESKLPIVIAAAQNYPSIYNDFVNLRIDEDRLISKLIL